jgi:hypothetical protein
MANRFKPAGLITVDAPEGVQGAGVTELSVGAASGPLGSVIHGLRIEMDLTLGSQGHVILKMGAADALQLAEEIRAAVQRRDDVKLQSPAGSVQ